MTIITPDHVKLRLEDAGRTLMMLPVPLGGVPAQHRCQWPDIVRQMADLTGAIVGATEDQKKEFAEDQNAVRLVPSTNQIHRMDEALDWYWLVEDAQHRRVCFIRSLRWPTTGRYVASLRDIAKVLSTNHETVRRWHSAALGEIAKNLSAHVDSCAGSGLIFSHRQRSASSEGGAFILPYSAARTSASPAQCL